MAQMFLFPTMATMSTQFNTGSSSTDEFTSGDQCYPEGLPGFEQPSTESTQDKWVTDSEVDNLLSDSFLNIDPESSFYINEFFSILVMLASSVYYYIF